MPKNKVLEQHIAVFGESGSGKTVLLSSFYGAAQQPQNIKQSKYHVVAEDPGQGLKLSQNYLGMKNSGILPRTDQFASTAFSFLLKLKDQPSAKAAKGQPFDALRLVWHDYPGQWFEQNVSGPKEALDRVETFRGLLNADVAVLLVDAQRLLDNQGEEDRYLKSLMTNFSNSLLLLKDDLLTEGKPLVKFPRIWILALSKADLLPDTDVFAFRDLVVEKARDDVEKLRDVLGGFVESIDAMSIGEDFALLSSAKFTPGKIEVTERIGLDLLLPLASVLPFERHLIWAQRKQVGRKVALALLGRVEQVAVALGIAGGIAEKILSKSSRLAAVVGFVLSRLGPFLDDNAEKLIAKLHDADKSADTRMNSVATVLVGFEADLVKAEDAQTFIRRP